MWRRLAVIATLLGAAALPAQASPPPTASPPTLVTVQGKAGTFLLLTLTRELNLGKVGAPLADLTADRGDLVGAALVDRTGTHWATFTRGQTRSCAMATTCERYDFPDVAASTRNRERQIVLPAGSYRLALIGRPGATLTLRTALPGLRAKLRTTGQAQLQVRDLTTTLPAVADQQPEAGGSAAFTSRGVTVTGIRFRLDSTALKEALFSLCLSGPRSGPPVAQGCDGASTGGGIYTYDCSYLPGVLCVPFSTGDSALTYGESTVRRGDVATSYDLETKALRSRVSAYAFALTLPDAR